MAIYHIKLDSNASDRRLERHISCMTPSVPRDADGLRRSVSGADFLAVDWGTTNRRVFHIADGKVVKTERDGRGAATIEPGIFEAEATAIRSQFGDLPMVLAGMVGSSIGWRTVPYVPVPVRLEDLSARLTWIDPRTAIVPGASSSADQAADVMRGEEVQLLGACHAGLAPADALLCQPGTHCKWARMEAGAIASFTTAMTGELFALLRAHSLLAPQLTGPVTPDQAFLDGVAEGVRRDLAASLFGIRSRGLLGRLDDRHAASFASGVLIGADAASRVAAGQNVHILADAELGALYAVAIEAVGGTAVLVDSNAAFVAGVNGLWELAA